MRDAQRDTNCVLKSAFAVRGGRVETISRSYPKSGGEKICHIEERFDIKDHRQIDYRNRISAQFRHNCAVFAKNAYMSGNRVPPAVFEA